MGAIDDFEAVELSLLNDEKGIALLSLNNHVLVSGGRDFFHGIDNNADVVLVEVAEENALLNQPLDRILGLSSLGNDFSLELSLDVELSENFSADALATVLFVSFLLFAFF